MKKEFILNIVFLALANLLIKPVYLLWVEVKVNNIVGPSTYGIFASLFSICYIFQLIADPGLLNYNTTYISANRHMIRDRFPLMLGLKLCLALVYVGFMYCFALISGYEETAWSIFPWIVMSLLLMSVNIFLRSNVSGLGKYRWDSFFSVLDKSLMIVILCLLIYGNVLGREFEILDFVKGQCLALGLTTVIITVVLGRFKVGLTPKIKFSEFSGILKKSLPYAWLVFFMTIYTRIDTYMLDMLVDDESYSAGVYAAGFRIFDAVNSFSYLFAALLLPMFSFMLSAKKPIFKLFHSSFRLLFIGIMVLSIFFCFYAGEIMQEFYPDDYTIVYQRVFLFLMGAIVPMSLAYISGSLLTADGRLKELNKIAFAGVIMNVILNVILIRNYNAMGAAIATLLTQSVMTTIQYWFVYRFFNIRVRWNVIRNFTLFIISIVLIALLSKEYSPLPFIINIGVGIIISIVIALGLKLIQLDNFVSLIKDRATR